MIIKQNEKLKLYGFNNLTKSLSFNMYDICYTKTSEERKEYLEYIDEEYNADRLTSILTKLTEIIGANILNIAKQDYDPQGASVTILICEDQLTHDFCKTETNMQKQVSETVLAHLDKSHITVHTYPEYHPDDGICTFRADIDVSTCGMISPLNALDFLINSFDADVMIMDYKVRGFTRDITGKKIFIDHEITSIQDYIPDIVKNKYNMIDVNVYQENIFHTKCKLRKFDLDNYLFGYTKNDLNPDEIEEISKKVIRETDEIFYGTMFSKITLNSN